MSETIEHSESSSLPDGWCLLTVNEIKSDKNYSCVGGPFGSNLTTADYVGSGGVPVIRGTNLSGSNNRFKDDGFVYVCEKKADSLRQNMAFPNDLIFTQRGTLGQVGHIPDNARFARYVVSQSQMKLTVSKNIASTDYIYHYFSSPNVLRLIENSVEATGVPHITLGILKSFPVPLPPLSQQRKIARILTTVDNLIEQTEALIEKYKSIKQGMMHDLFTRGVDQSGQLRPPYEDAPELYKESELGWIPKEWEVCTVSEFASDERHAIVDGPFGSNLKTIHYRENGRRVIQSGFVTSNSFDASRYLYVDESKFRAEIRSKVSPGDIVMAKIGAQCGTCAVLPAGHPVGILAGNCLKITVAKNNSTSYLESLLHRKYAVGELSIITTTTAQPALSMSSLKLMPIKYPPPDEQYKIVARLDAMKRRMDEEHRLLAKLLNVKSGLMHDLLTGKVRVNVDETEEVTADV